jgi:hypothetical protein
MSGRKTSSAINAERRGTSPGSVKPRKGKRRKIRCMPTWTKKVRKTRICLCNTAKVKKG